MGGRLHAPEWAQTYIVQILYVRALKLFLVWAIGVRILLQAEIAEAIKANDKIVVENGGTADARDRSAFKHSKHLTLVLEYFAL
jgi:hypothetical protein